MTEVHREGRVSLHVIKDGAVELREFDSHGTLRSTTADGPLLATALEESERGLSANEVCRRYAARADVDFGTAAAAVLDELESRTREADDD